MSELVRLQQVWKWECPHCGVENYAEGQPAEMTHHERLEAAQALGIPDEKVDEYGQFICLPTTVCCGQCEMVSEVDFDESEE